MQFQSLRSLVFHCTSVRKRDPIECGTGTERHGIGSVMALIIGSAGASLTEVILLKSIFKNQMIAAFLFVILSMAIGAGYLYTVLFG